MTSLQKVLFQCTALMCHVHPFLQGRWSSSEPSRTKPSRPVTAGPLGRHHTPGGRQTRLTSAFLASEQSRTKPSRPVTAGPLGRHHTPGGRQTRLTSASVGRRPANTSLGHSLPRQTSVSLQISPSPEPRSFSTPNLESEFTSGDLFFDDEDIDTLEDMLSCSALGIETKVQTE